MIKAHYSPFCLCSHCSQTTLFELGISALEPSEFIRRAMRYNLTEKQQGIVDAMTLKLWNECVKGESA